MSESEEPPGGSTGPPQTGAGIMSNLKSFSKALYGILKDLEDKDFEEFKFFLTNSTETEKLGVIKKCELENKSRIAVLQVMMDTYGLFTIDVMEEALKNILHNQALQELRSYRYNREAEITAYRKHFQSHLNQKFRYMDEGLSKTGERTLFEEVYTKVYITEVATRHTSKHHEAKQMEGFSRTSALKETQIQCQDIFKEAGEPIRVVLTKGVAGVGKTVLTQKFSLDWARNEANKNIQLLFHLNFRDLNKFEGKKYSLVDLLHLCFEPSKALFSFQCLKLLFILDGLDECRLCLNFGRTQVLTDPTESAAVESLLVNLILGHLLPFAHLWITTRPAAASQIPEDCICLITEARGFDDKQKSFFIRQRITDDQKATAIISHIKSLRSLDAMSRIPIFCKIISTVLLKILKETPESELPKTLTEMYVRFLVIQAKAKNVKYEGRSEADQHWTEDTRTMVWALGKLAFEQLLRGKLDFSDCDVEDCGLDIVEIARYAGVFKEVFKEEPKLYVNKGYGFIHLSMHEFMAALHVHQNFFSVEEKKNLLASPLSVQNPESRATKSSKPRSKKRKRPNTKQTKNVPNKRPRIQEPSQTTSQPRAVEPESSRRSGIPDRAQSDPDESGSDPDESGSGSDPEDEPPLSSEPTEEEKFYRCAVDQALQSPNGHLDLFLRFLLGLSLPTNQKLLQGLIRQTGSDQTNQQTVKYIRKKLNETEASAERSLNLLDFLNELKDSRLLDRIKKLMTRRKLSARPMTRAQWLAVSFLLLSSNSDLEEFDLREYCPSEEALMGLLPVVQASTKVILSDCKLTVSSCAPLGSVLVSSALKHLDLSKNHLQDSGLEQLCEGLKSDSLETLSLSSCGLTSLSCAPLAEVLLSSALKHLDLSENLLQDSGLEQLCEGLKSDSLETLRLQQCGLSDLSCEHLKSVLKVNPSSTLTNLDLRENSRMTPAKITELNNIITFSSRSNYSEKELLLSVLEELSNNDLEAFKFLLMELYPGIPKSVLDRASRVDLVDALVSRYSVNAIKITARILRRLNYNDLPHKLYLGSEPESGDEPFTWYSSDAQGLLRSVRMDFVSEVSDPVLDQLLDRLLQQGVLSNQEMENIRTKPRAEKARALIDTVTKKGRKASLILIQEYCELDPLSDLSRKLQASWSRFRSGINQD